MHEMIREQPYITLQVQDSIVKEILQKIYFIQTKNVISSEGSKDLSKCWRISIIFCDNLSFDFFMQMQKRFAAAWIF